MPTPKESPKESRKRRAPEEPAHRSDSVYPAGQDVKAQQERLRKAAVAASTDLKPSTPVVAPAQAIAVQKAPASAPVKAPATAAATPAAAAVKAPAAPSPKPSPPTPAKAPEKATGSATTKTRNLTFVFSGPNAKRVSVSGEFNGWSPDATPMKRRSDGQWEKTLALKPGRYQYKFVVDGNWTHDPTARENVRNEHGSLNSVTEIRP